MAGFTDLLQPVEWAGLWRSIRHSPDRVREQRSRRLRAIARHAAKNVRFYRERFRTAGLNPDSIRSVADLNRIPITTKQEFQQAPPRDVMASGVRSEDCAWKRTSGSSGRPIDIARTPYEDHVLQACRIRAMLASGMRPWDTRIALLNGEKRRPHPLQKLGLLRQIEIDACREIDQILDDLTSLQPDVLRSTPLNYYRLLEALDSRELARIRPRRLLFCGGEMLAAGLRRRIETAFERPLVEFYGSHEFNIIAWECRDCGLYHTVDDAVIVEVLDDDDRPVEPGAEGRVVATALRSFAMPFIRFELGDLARRPESTPCCAIPFGAIDGLIGRSTDTIRLPGGELFNPYHLILAMQGVSGVGRFQFVQEAPSKLVVTFEASHHFAGPRDLVGAVAAACRKDLPAGALIEAKQVQRLIEDGPKLKIVQGFGAKAETVSPPNCKPLEW